MERCVQKTSINGDYDLRPDNVVIIKIGDVYECYMDTDFENLINDPDNIYYFGEEPRTEAYRLYYSNLFVSETIKRYFNEGMRQFELLRDDASMENIYDNAGNEYTYNLVYIAAPLNLEGGDDVSPPSSEDEQEIANILASMSASAAGGASGFSASSGSAASASYSSAASQDEDAYFREYFSRPAVRRELKEYLRDPVAREEEYERLGLFNPTGLNNPAEEDDYSIEEKKKRSEIFANRYRNDPAFREKDKERVKEYRRRKYANDPEWAKKVSGNARAYRKQRSLADPEYREKLLKYNREYRLRKKQPPPE